MIFSRREKDVARLDECLLLLRSAHTGRLETNYVLSILSHQAKSSRQVSYPDVHPLLFPVKTRQTLISALPSSTLAECEGWPEVVVRVGLPQTRKQCFPKAG